MIVFCNLIHCFATFSLAFPSSLLKLSIIRIRPSTRFQIVCGFKNFHSGERIQKVVDSHANSPDTCGRKANPERKSCGFNYIRIRADGASIHCFATFSLTFPSSLLKLCIICRVGQTANPYFCQDQVFAWRYETSVLRPVLFHPPQIFLRKIKESEVSFFEVDHVLPWFTHTLHFAADCAQITGKLRTE